MFYIFTCLILLILVEYYFNAGNVLQKKNMLTLTACIHFSSWVFVFQWHKTQNKKHVKL